MSGCVRNPSRIACVAGSTWSIDRHHMPMRPAASKTTSTEVLAGLIERVTFHNEEPGFCVLRVKARGQRDLITLLGHGRNSASGSRDKRRP